MLASLPRPSPRIAIVRNPRSGSAPEASELARAARASQVPVTVADVPEGAASTPWLRRMAADFDVVVAAGGDGTVSAVAAAVASAGKTLAVIPTGTLNHFARDVGIPIDLDKAAAVIAAGHERTVDLGVVNEHLFINNVSFGNYPRMVHEREALERDGRAHTLATTIAIARTWWHLRKLAVVLTIDDGKTVIRRSPFIVVGNGSYTLSGLALGRRDEISDGRLSLYVSPSSGRLGALSLPFRALLGTLERHEQFETFFASKIVAEFARRTIVAAIDGEVAELTSPLEITIRRNVLRVLVPFDSTQGKPA
jgi:diacylglycerol kinase family enzyme